jgi:beta-RFAP synthase
MIDKSRQGMHGEAEVKAFKALPPFPATAAAHLCHLVLMRALPAVAEHDLPQFGAAISAIQAELGQYFAPAQGGLFTSPLVGEAVQFLAAQGACGSGQSSWGPTGFVFTADATSAAALAATFRRENRFAGIDLIVTAANNRGAVIGHD